MSPRRVNNNVNVFQQSERIVTFNMLKLSIGWFTKILRGASKRPFQWQNRFHPWLELLETRLAPATCTWIGGALTENWSDPQNWRRNLGDFSVAGVPQAADSVFFGGIGADPNKNSTVDVAWLQAFLATQPAGTVATLDRLSISGYTGTITLGQALTASTFDQSSGTLKGAFPLTVTTGGSWTGGTLEGNGNPVSDTLVIKANAFFVVKENQRCQDPFRGYILALDGHPF